MNKSRDKIKTNEMDLIKTKYKQKMQIILQYKKLRVWCVFCVGPVCGV